MSRQTRTSQDDATAIAVCANDFAVGDLVGRMHEAVIVIDASSGCVVLWSSAAEKLFGYTADEIAGKAVEMIVPERYKASHRAGLARYLQSGHGAFIDGTSAIELPATHKDGTELHVELTLAPIESRTRSGRFVLAVVRDVAERQRSESERSALIREQAARSEAETAKRRFALLAEASAVFGGSLDFEATVAAVARLAVPELADWCVIHLAHGDGHIHSVAATHRDGLKVRALQVLGISYPSVTVKSSRKSENPVASVINTGNAVFMPSAPPDLTNTILPDPVQHRVLRSEPIRSFICVPLTAGDRITGAITLARTTAEPPYTSADLALAKDIAARAAMAIDNARLYQEARDAIKVRDEFLASASHELRTPVTTIKAFSQMLQRRLLHGGTIDVLELQEALQSIDSNASRLAAQINELLDLSRLQAGRPIELYRRPTDLVLLLKKAVEKHQSLSGRHSIRAEISPAELTGNWDGFRLERVLSSLLSNAVKYSPSDTEIVVALCLDPTRRRKTAVLTVHDRGIGIPEADLPHVFEKFYRAANVPERAYGTGTGLAGALEILRLHGGTIGIESAEGGGTTCTVILPCDDAPTTLIRSSGN